MFTILSVVMVSWVYTNVKIYQTVHFNYVEFIVCQLYFCKKGENAISDVVEPFNP